MPTLTSNLFLLGLFLAASSDPVLAVPQVDLSVSGKISPNPLPVGGVGLATITVHNSGPDTAGAVLPTSTIVIVQDPFDITFGPAPIRITDVQEDCGFEDFFSDADEQGHVYEIFLFYMGPIAAGQDRSCSYKVASNGAAAGTTIPAGWLVDASIDHDTNNANNSFPYSLQVASASPLPATSPFAILAAAFGVLAIAYSRRRRLLDELLARDR